MTFSAIVFMAIAWTVIGVSTAWCLWKLTSK